MTRTPLFDGAATELPEGMQYRSELISPATERSLVENVSELPFKEFEFHGYQGKRRTVSFGWQYEFSGRGRLLKASAIPDFLLPLRKVVAEFARTEVSSLQHVLVVEYGPGAGIGWHRDKPVFGEVIGVSLLAPCVLRFRRKLVSSVLDPETNRRSLPHVETKDPTTKTRWQRVNVTAEPRSAYHLTGPARSEWQHSILRVDQLRYSITFRSLHED